MFVSEYVELNRVAPLASADSGNNRDDRREASKVQLHEINGDSLMRPYSATGRPAILFALVAAICCACSSTKTAMTTFATDGMVPLGTWGGDSAGLIVGDTALHLHIGCTFGDVSGRVAVDANGRFDVQGSYMLRAYPVSVGPAVPARFVGRVEGSDLTVTVTVDDTVEHKSDVRGPVKVHLGDDPRLGPCPICRRPVHTKGQALGAGH